MSEPSAVAIPPSPREQVISWLLEGHRDSDIKAAIAERWPEEDAHALAVSAVDHFAKAATCDRRVVVGWGMEAYRDLYRKMLDIGDYANAMKAVKELVALATKHVYGSDDPETTDDEKSDSDEIE